MSIFLLHMNDDGHFDRVLFISWFWFFIKHQNIIPPIHTFPKYSHTHHNITISHPDTFSKYPNIHHPIIYPLIQSQITLANTCNCNIHHPSINNHPTSQTTAIPNTPHIIIPHTHTLSNHSYRPHHYPTHSHTPKPPPYPPHHNFTNSPIHKAPPYPPHHHIIPGS